MGSRASEYAEIGEPRAAEAADDGTEESGGEDNSGEEENGIAGAKLIYLSG